MALPAPVTAPLPEGEPWSLATDPAQTLSSSAIKAGSFPRLSSLSVGDLIAIPLEEGREIQGRVNGVRVEADGSVLVGGAVDGDDLGSFAFAERPSGKSGIIRLPHEKVGYVVETSANGQVLLQKRPISVIECAGMPVAPGEGGATQQAGNSGPQSIVVPPNFDSRPSATAVLYLDFDGETVTDPLWNRGGTIVAAPATLGGSEITPGGMLAVCEAVSEDFKGFNVTVTCNRSRYDGAPVGWRMRCIVTTTKTAAPTAGGVAYLNSFSGAGAGSFSSDIPCWSYNQNNVEIMAMTISHELGHTLGLSHDGTLSAAYYGGHGTGAASWGPIMGAPFGANLVHWSKGEYFQANNTVEDDNAIISSSRNHFGFLADDYPNTRTAATLIDNETGTIDKLGVVERLSDVDFFKINTFGGPLSVAAGPAQPVPSYDAKLELYDSAGTLLAAASDVGTLSATINATLARGTYYIAVSGGAEGTPTVPSPTGWTNYGSQGEYQLTGTFVPLPDIPLVTLDPIPQAVNEGTAATFTVAATCRGPIRYQWQKDGVNVKGATSATYRIARVTPAQQGIYRCKLTNGAGDPLVDFVYSADAALDVRQKPRVTTQPLAVAANQGDNVNFSVVATGYAPLLYQWQKNNVDLVGETSDTLSLSNVQIPDIANYRVRISNAAGFVYSNAAKLTVSSAPFILVPPQDLNLVTGSTGRFSVKAAGDPRLTYQWFFNGTPIARATGTTLTVKGLPTSVGSYFVVISNPKGPTTSAAVNLAIFDRPIITSHPVGATVNAGDSLTLSVAATGTDLHYQWQFKRVNIPSANSSTLDLSPVGWFDAGAYRCIVSNAAASATSREATVKVLSPPIITTEPADTKVARKKTAVFRVVATGSPALKYQWMKNGVDIPRATKAVLTISRADAANEGNYSVRITNPFTAPAVPGTPAVVSRAASLTVEDPPVITVQPETNKYFAIGSSLTLSVGATGSPTLLYQWQKSNVNLVGQTSDTLNIPNAQTTDAGKYRVLVTNDVGKATSRTVTAFVIVGPSVTVHPLSQNAYVGDAVTLSIAAVGGKPLKYQWRKDGIAIPRATAATYKISNAQLTHAGSYDVVVSNPVGSVISNPANLVIDPIPAPVVSLFTPTQGKVGAKVEITGQNLRWTTSVKIGSKPAAFVRTGDDLLVATVAFGTVSGPITVTTKGGSATTAQNFIVTTAYANDDFADSMILTGTGNSLLADNRGFTREGGEPAHAGVSSGRSAWWKWTCPKSGRYAIDLVGSKFDTVLAVYRPSATVAGFGGLISEAYNDDFRSDLTSRVVFTAIQGTSYYTAVSAYGGGLGGYIIFSHLTTAQSPPEPEATFDVNAGFVVGAALGGQKDWKADSEEATAVVTDPIGGGQVAKLGGVKGVSAEPVCLWHALPESVEGTGQKVYVSFDANLDLAATGNSKDQFSWSIYNEREEPLLALWMSAEDGSMRVVNASGQAWDLDAKLVAGASQKFAFEVDPVAATWGLSLDGVSMFDGQSLGVDSSEARLGDVSAIWLPGSTEPAALVFDNFSITTELDSASIAADGEAETEAAAQATLIVK
ncbi:MAG: immunoglobulin domain-containing protein [Verrucomicrobiaceae bacterium]|nr:immunoglobulin domain-containing protein [Verrucomicrobiaceae bacterium]